MFDWKNSPEEKGKRIPGPLIRNTRKYQVFGNLERKWAKIEHDIEKILSILKEENFFLGSELKNLPNIKIRFQKMTLDGTIYFETSEKVPLTEIKEFILYKKQKSVFVELIFELVSIDDRILACRPRLARSSEEERRHSRITVSGNDIYAKSFQVADIDKELLSYLPTDDSILKSIEKDYKETHPKIELVYLFSNSELSFEESIVALEGKPIFLQSAKDLETFPGDFIDIKNYYQAEGIVQTKLKDFSERNISSLLCYPLFFRLAGKEVFIGVGYLHAENPKQIPTSDIFIMEEIETRFNRTILESFNVVLDEEQSVANISESGVLFQIHSQKLAEAILARPHFTAELCFSGEECLELSFLARNIYKIQENYYIGAEAIGNIYANPNVKKYLNYIQKRKIN
jgi:hypothetical protein